MSSSIGIMRLQPSVLWQPSILCLIPLRKNSSHASLRSGILADFYYRVGAFAVEIFHEVVECKAACDDAERLVISVDVCVPLGVFRLFHEFFLVFESSSVALFCECRKKDELAFVFRKFELVRSDRISEFDTRAGVRKTGRETHENRSFILFGDPDRFNGNHTYHSSCRG